MLKSKILRLVLALAAGLGAPLCLGGCDCCTYLGDATRKDLQKVAEIPQAFADGVKRDIAIYRLVHCEKTGDNWKP
jgi:hypothetical protein